MKLHYNSGRPFYLLRKELINCFFKEELALVENFRNYPAKKVCFNISNESLNQENPEEIITFFKIMQHYPDLYERMVQNVGLSFDEVKDWTESETHHNYKYDLRICWFYELSSSFPPSIFFIKSSVGRLFSLIGDEPELVESLDIIGADREPKIDFTALSPVMQRKLTLKVRSKAAAFYTYCYGSGFDPSIYIAAVIADLKMDLSLKEIKHVWETSMQLKIVADSIGMDLLELWSMRIFVD